MSSTALVSGCSLLAPVAFCDGDAECRNDQICGTQGICEQPQPDREDAGSPVLPDPPDPDPPETPDLDEPLEPEVDAGSDGDAGELTDGRTDAGHEDAGTIPEIPLVDAGIGAVGRPVGATPPGTSTPPIPPADAGTDPNGRCTADGECADGEACEQGVCVET